MLQITYTVTKKTSRYERGRFFNFIVKLQFRKQSASELASCNETQTLKATRIKVC